MDVSCGDLYLYLSIMCAWILDTKKDGIRECVTGMGRDDVGAKRV